MPITKVFNPRPYQEKIIAALLSHSRYAIWAGMGMGKTVSTLTALSYLIPAFEDGPALILAPLRVAATTWPDEAKKWPHLKDVTVVPIVGSEETRSRRLNIKANVYATNYESLPWLIDKYGENWPFTIVVADEVTRLKNFRLRGGSTRAAALAKVAWSKVKRFIELTGTPAPNGLLDLWGQAWFLDCGQSLGTSFTAFRDRWFTPVRVGATPQAVRWEPRVTADKEIEARINHLVLKINPEDYFDITKPLVYDIEVKLPRYAMQRYQEMENDLFTVLASQTEVESVNAAVNTNKCLQIAGGAIYTEGEEFEEIHKQKLEALKSIVENANGMPVLVSYQFKHECYRILKEFPHARLLDKNPQTIRDWNEGRVPMLVAHPASCGHGLNLQDGGNILVFYSTGWNLEEHDQMIERIGPTRQKQAGHPRPVFVYNLIAKDTMDEAVQERLKTKRSVMDILLERKKEKEK